MEDTHGIEKGWLAGTQGEGRLGGDRMGGELEDREGSGGGGGDSEGMGREETIVILWERE